MVVGLFCSVVKGFYQLKICRIEEKEGDHNFTLYPAEALPFQEAENPFGVLQTPEFFEQELGTLERQ